MEWLRLFTQQWICQPVRRVKACRKPTVCALESRIVLTVSGAEQLYLELVNRARANPGAEAARYSIDLNEGLAAGTIANTPRQPLALNGALHVAIQGHLQDMIDHDFFSHTGFNGSTFTQRIQSSGYTGYSTVGENLAFMGTTATPDVEQSVHALHRDLFVDEGIAGRGHRTNMLQVTFKETGSGVRTGVYTSGGTNFNSVFVGNDFGAKAVNSFVTGVAYTDTISANNFYSLGEGLAGLEVRVSGTPGTFQTTTNEAGGYQIAVPAGTYTVTFTGAALITPIQKSVTIGSENQKIDLNRRTDTPLLPVLSLQASTVSVSEGTGTVTIRVNLSAPSTTAVTVDYATFHGTATAGSDYTDRSGTLTFAPGETFQTFTIPITDDELFEPSESFQVSLSSPANATLGTPGSSVVTITNNDLPGVMFSTATGSGSEATTSTTFTVTLQTVSTQTVTVQYAVSGGTASSGVDFQLASGMLTFLPGVTSRTFSLAVINDAYDEENQTVAVTLSSPTNASLGPISTRVYTIVDNDSAPSVRFDFRSLSNSLLTSVSVSEAGNYLDVPVQLSAASERSVQVNLGTIAGGTAIGGIDYQLASGVVDFAPGETRKTVRLNILEDNLDEFNETIKLKLLGALNATPSTTGVTVTLLDNDLAPSVSFVEGASSGREEIATPAPIQVQLSAISGRTVTVRYAVSRTGTTASSRYDYSLASGTLTFLLGETVKSLPLILRNDTTREANETLRIVLSSPSGASLGSLISHLFTIIDDESNPIV